MEKDGTTKELNRRGMRSKMERKRLDSLQALRALACIGVMLSHAGFSGRAFAGSGAWGVSVFFVLSGFVMIYSYYGRGKIQSCSMKDSFRFALGRIKKLYPLMIIASLPIYSFQLQMVPFVKTIPQVILNLLLLQEWLPLRDRSILGVSWYLCVMMFFWLIFPAILQYMEKNYNRKKACSWIAVSALMQIIVALIGKALMNVSADAGSIWTGDFCEWFVYKFPLSRIWDIVLGMNLGYLFLTTDRLQKLSVRRCTLLETVSVLLAAAAWVVYALCTPKITASADTLFILPPANVNSWWNYTLLFTVSTVFLVCSFALDRGRLSKILKNRFLLYIARLSPYLFITHFTVFFYICIYLYQFSQATGNPIQATYGGWINITVGSLISVILAQIWMKLESLVLRKKKKTL